MNLQQHNISDNNFEQCIKCTICTVYCPVAAVNPNYPGPKQAGPDGERLRLKKFNFYDDTEAGNPEGLKGGKTERWKLCLYLFCRCG